MPTTPPPLQFSHQKGFEIETEHKNAIHELHGFGEKSNAQLMDRYKLGRSTIHRILDYETTTRARLTRTGRPSKLTDARMSEIIEYCSEKWDNRILDYNALIRELKLDCAASTLQKRLHQRGYFRCVTCQKPYLTAAQVIGRLLWAIIHIFWTKEWLKVLWSDEVTFLVGGEVSKGESDEEERGANAPNVYTAPVSSWWHDPSQRLGSNWIWLQESFAVRLWI
jgi:transposase